jgi:hypothetical protein
VAKLRQIWSNLVKFGPTGTKNTMDGSEAALRPLDIKRDCEEKPESNALSFTFSSLFYHL